MLTGATITEEAVRIRGQGHALEGVLSYHDDGAGCSALIAGPHPFLGGDRRNNVVQSLSTALAAQGAVALTFNYGGVGQSEGGPADWPAVMSEFWKEGAFKEEHGWAEDAGAAMAALRQWCDFPLVVIGYSFGCWAAVRNLNGSRAKAIVLISPNPKQHTFDPLSGCAAPLLVIHSDNDFVCTASELKAWFGSIREPKLRIQLSAGEHFFRGCEESVSSVVLGFLTDHDILTPK